MRQAIGTIAHFLLVMAGLVLMSAECQDFQTHIIGIIVGFVLFVLGCIPAIIKSNREEGNVYAK